MNLEHTALNLISNPLSINAGDAFVDSIRNEEDLFYHDENSLFDYKDKFPFEDDDHFNGFLRLALAFYNSYGGIIVLGVHDETREYRKGGTRPNLEKLNIKLLNYTGREINVRLISCNLDFKAAYPQQSSISVSAYHHTNKPKMPVQFLDERSKKALSKSNQRGKVNEIDNEHTNTSIDLLVIPQRNPAEAPAALIKPLKKGQNKTYPIGTIWIRRGPEVHIADSSQIPFLFGPRNYEGDIKDNQIERYLPGKPNKIEKFVGRVSLITQLMNWITQEDEARKFLWGRGGCGKTTLAYEFASIFSENGKLIPTNTGQFFDRVIFVSAKEKKLNTESGQITETYNKEFSTLDELLSIIAQLCHYSQDLDYEKLERTELEKIVKEIFDFESILLIIDDIDTLSTKGIETGKDLLFKLALRAQQTIRILYTQRNKELENSIEVPGFEEDEELEKFVENCCKQFDVPLPNNKFLYGRLKDISEGIPLIIETLIGLRKRCDNYETAEQIFMQRGGEEARNYLFEREYEALTKQNKAKEILTTISEYGKAISIKEIASIHVNIGQETISQGIGEILSFFLTTQTSEKGETTYFMNPVTNMFIKNKTKTLDFGPQIVERVKSYKTAGRNKPKEVIDVEAKINTLIARGEFNEAIQVIKSQKDPKITENTSFRNLSGLAYAKCNPPRITDARECFDYCVTHKHLDLKCLRIWYYIEKESSKTQQEICDVVLQNPAFNETVKNEFMNKKATSLYNQSRHLTGTIDTYEILKSALDLRNRTFVYFTSMGTATPEDEYRYAQTLAGQLTQTALKFNYEMDLWTFFKGLSKATNGLIEPLFNPLTRLLQGFERNIHDGNISKIRGQIMHMTADTKRGEMLFERERHKAMILEYLSRLSKKTQRDG